MAVSPTPNQSPATGTPVSSEGLNEAARLRLEIDTASSIATLKSEVSSIKREVEGIDDNAKKVPSILTTIRFHTVAFIAIASISGWAGTTLFSLNKEVGQNTSKFSEVAIKIDANSKEIASIEDKLDSSHKVNQEILEKLNMLISDSQFKDKDRTTRLQNTSKERLD